MLSGRWLYVFVLTYAAKATLQKLMTTVGTCFSFTRGRRRKGYSRKSICELLKPFEGYVGQSLCVVCFVVVNNRKKMEKKDEFGPSSSVLSILILSRHPKSPTMENVRIERKWTIDFISGSGKNRGNQK